jgi:hypothetical protein
MTLLASDRELRRSIYERRLTPQQVGLPESTTLAGLFSVSAQVLTPDSRQLAPRDRST